MRSILTEKAAAPIGPYSQAVVTGDLLFVSGQIAIRADETTAIGEGVEKETHQVMRNLSIILEAAGLSWSNVAKCSIFVTNIHDFQKVNEVYGSYLHPGHLPARETVQVAELPKGAAVEISLIASLK